MKDWSLNLIKEFRSAEDLNNFEFSLPRGKGLIVKHNLEYLNEISLEIDNIKSNFDSVDKMQSPFNFYVSDLKLSNKNRSISLNT